MRGRINTSFSSFFILTIKLAFKRYQASGNWCCHTIPVHIPACFFMYPVIIHLKITAMNVKNIRKNLTAALGISAVTLAVTVFTACNNHPNQIGEDQVITGSSTNDNGGAGNNGSTDSSSNAGNSNTAGNGGSDNTGATPGNDASGSGANNAGGNTSSENGNGNMNGSSNANSSNNRSNPHGPVNKDNGNDTVKRSHR